MSIFGEEKEEFKRIVSQAENLEGRFRIGGSKSDSFSDFGLCKDCGNFIACCTKFEKRFAKCDAWLSLKLDPNDPVEFCTVYYKRGQLDIHTLKDMATMIEVKRDIGFLKDEEEK